MNTSLSTDEFYQIMLQLNIRDIQSLCSVTTQYHYICNSSDFWKKKVVIDELPLINNPSSINDYLHIKYAADMVKKHYKSYIAFELKDEDILKILPLEYSNQIKKLNYNKIKLFFHSVENSIIKPTLLYASFDNDKSVERLKFESSKLIMLDILFNLFYYYPEVKMVTH